MYFMLILCMINEREARIILISRPLQSFFSTII